MKWIMLDKMTGLQRRSKGYDMELYTYKDSPVICVMLEYGSTSCSESSQGNWMGF